MVVHGLLTTIAIRHVCLAGSPSALDTMAPLYVSLLHTPHIRLLAVVIDVRCDAVDWHPVAPSTCLLPSGASGRITQWPSWATPYTANTTHVAWGECEVGLSEGEGVHICTKALERVGIASAGATRMGPVYNLGCHRGADGAIRFPLVVTSPSPSRAPTSNPTSTLKPTGVPTPGPTTFARRHPLQSTAI